MALSDKAMWPPSILAPLGGAVPYEWLLGSLLLRWPAI